MDFSITTGWSGWIAWRLGIVDLWQKKLKRRPPRPAPPVRTTTPGQSSRRAAPMPSPSVKTGA
jgi:hypothetical protein